MKKKILLVLSVCAVIAAGVLFFKSQSSMPGYTGEIKGELKILSSSPSGENVYPDADGLVVMADHPLVPLGDLQTQNKYSPPLKIVPDLKGHVRWLGSKAFVFKPDGPLPVATSFTATLSKGLVSQDGYELKKDYQWQFSTVTPKVLSIEPSGGQIVSPDKTVVRLIFNVAMNAADVEKKIKITTAKGDVSSLFEKSWDDGNHILQLKIKKELPWDSELSIEIPSQVLAAAGNLGSKESFKSAFTTPPSSFLLNRVFTYESYQSDKNVIEAREGTPLTVPENSALCAEFNQPFVRDSFEKAFLQEGQKKEEFYAFYIDGVSSSEFDPVSKKTVWNTYYKTACFYPRAVYPLQAKFSIDNSKMVSVSGAKSDHKTFSYAVANAKPKPWLGTLLTKTLFEDGHLPSLPFQSYNIDKVRFRFFPVNMTSGYSDGWIGVPFENLKEAQGKISGSATQLPLNMESKEVDVIDSNLEFEVEQSTGGKKNEEAHWQLPLQEKVSGLHPGLYVVEAKAVSAIDDSTDNLPEASFTLIQVSPYAVAIKRDVDQSLVWLTPLSADQKLSREEVMVFSYDDTGKIKSEVKATTDEKGVALVKGDFTGYGAVCVQTTSQADYAMACSDSNALAYDSTMTKGPHYFSYIYTDRPIYKPGQKVEFSSYVREVLEGHYLMPKQAARFTVTATDAKGEVLYEKNDVVPESGGMIRGEFELASDEAAPRGTYNVEIKSVDSGQSFAKNFYVASYKKPSFKFSLDPLAKEIVNSEELKVSVAAQYFFGAPLRSAPYRWNLMTQTYFFSPEGFESFNFVDDDLFYKKSSGDEGESFSLVSPFDYDSVAYGPSEDQSYAIDDPKNPDQSAGNDLRHLVKDSQGKPVLAEKLVLSDLGLANVAYKTNIDRYPTSQQLSLEVSVQDISHQEVSQSVDVIVHKALHYVGVKPESYVYGKDERAKFDIVSLTDSGKILPQASVDVEIFKRDYKMASRQGASGYWEDEFEKEDKKLKSMTVKTNAQGSATLDYPLSDGEGTYRIKISSKDKLGNVSRSAAEVYCWGQGYAGWKLDNPQTIELVPDRKRYNPGDTAHVLIKSLFPISEVLFTLERGRVLKYKVIPLGGNAGKIDIPIEAGFAPNIYVSLLAHTNASGQPKVFFGETMLEINPDPKELNVALTLLNPKKDGSEPQYAPGEKVRAQVKVTDKSGQPLESDVIVSVADESVLKLIGYKKPDLIKKFYFLRPKRIMTSTSFMAFKAGDGSPKSDKKRSVFKDTAAFEAHLHTDGSGVAQFEFTLPDDLTTWVMEALAVTPSKTSEEFYTEWKSKGDSFENLLSMEDNTKVGSSRKNFITTRDILVRAELPRFARPHDHVIVKIIALNKSDKAFDGKLTVNIKQGVVATTQPFEFNVSLKSGGEAAFDLPLQIEADSRLVMETTLADLKNVTQDALETTIPIKANPLKNTVALSGSTSKTATEYLEFNQKYKPSANLTASVTPSLAIKALGVLDNLRYFAWECAEQKSAKMMANIMSLQLIDLYGDQIKNKIVFRDRFGEIEKVSDPVATLKNTANLLSRELTEKFRSEDGGVLYWPSSEEAHVLASSQTLSALKMAYDYGLDADQTRMDEIRDFLMKKISDTKNPLSASDQITALTGINSVDPVFASDHVGLLSDTNSADELSHLLLIAGPQSGSAKKLQDGLRKLAVYDPRFVSWPSSQNWTSSTVANTALAARALLFAKADDELVKRGLEFLLSLKNKTQLTTQESLSIAKLVLDYASVTGEASTHFDARVDFNQKEILAHSFKPSDLLAKKEQAYLAKDLSLSDKNEIKISKEGEGTLYYSLLFDYEITPDDAQDAEEGMVISSAYYDLDDVKKEHPLKQFVAGQTYKGEVTLVVPHDLNEVVVEDPLPACFQPVDMTLAVSSKADYLKASAQAASYDDGGYPLYTYDDRIELNDFSSDWNFAFQEVRDDRYVWSDSYLPKGNYHITYPVRAVTEGESIKPGALAQLFYYPEIFARAKPALLTVKAK